MVSGADPTRRAPAAPREFFLKTLHASLFPKFLPHELNEQVKPIVSQETTAAANSPSVSALDHAHRVAFRQGLGNSLFASAAEPVSTGSVKQLFASAFTQEIGLIGQGIDTATLEGHAGDLFGEELDIQLENHKVPFNAGQTPAPTTYHGGEERVAIDLHLVPEIQPTLVVAFGLTQGWSAESAVLPYLLGATPALKWSAGDSSPLAKAAAATAGSSARAHVSHYSDAKLLAIEVKADGSKRLSETGKAVVAAVNELAAGKLDADAVRAAIAQAKFAAASNAEYTANVAEIVAAQVRPPPDRLSVGVGRQAPLLTVHKLSSALPPRSSPAAPLRSPTRSRPLTLLRPNRLLRSRPPSRPGCLGVAPD